MVTYEFRFAEVASSYHEARPVVAWETFEGFYLKEVLRVSGLWSSFWGSEKEPTGRSCNNILQPKIRIATDSHRSLFP